VEAHGYFKFLGGLLLLQLLLLTPLEFS